MYGQAARRLPGIGPGDQLEDQSVRVPQSHDVRTEARLSLHTCTASPLEVASPEIA